MGRRSFTLDSQRDAALLARLDAQVNSYGSYTNTSCVIILFCHWDSTVSPEDKNQPKRAG